MLALLPAISFPAATVCDRSDPSRPFQPVPHVTGGVRSLERAADGDYGHLYPFETESLQTRGVLFRF